MPIQTNTVDCGTPLALSDGRLKAFGPVGAVEARRLHKLYNHLRCRPGCRVGLMGCTRNQISRRTRTLAWPVQPLGRAGGPSRILSGSLDASVITAHLAPYCRRPHPEIVFGESASTERSRWYGGPQRSMAYSRHRRTG